MLEVLVSSRREYLNSGKMSFTPIIFLLCLSQYISLSEISIESLMDGLTDDRFRKPSLFYYSYNHKSCFLKLLIIVLILFSGPST